MQLRLAGDGRLRDAVRDAAQKHANVEWVGHVTGTAKRRFLEACDFGLIPSVWAEPGGPTFTMAEWLSGGRPVLVSRRGGLGEVAGVYPGSVAVEPCVQSIVEATASAVHPPRWAELVSAALSTRADAGARDWTLAHSEIYSSALGDGLTARALAAWGEAASGT